ncbi:Protein of unknown function [Chryseobacterium formosense]|uniref:DUF2281 domain-containing protein n=1 Tax=Chryseobacterium TaxID=59732 RepID=UPI000691BD42|nr:MULTISPECIES: DUF2281 domain-containing protein [Chryseobacterium]SFT61615.1 Protein of unknown function [Chryseobacterium formosense]
MEISIKEIEQNLKSLPKEFLGQVNDYIEFLKSKYSEAKTERDWADNLTDSQKQSINKGFDDIKNEKTYSHEEAKEKIKQYLLEKSK